MTKELYLDFSIRDEASCAYIIIAASLWGVGEPRYIPNLIVRIIVASLRNLTMSVGGPTVAGLYMYTNTCHCVRIHICMSSAF